MSSPNQLIRMLREFSYRRAEPGQEFTLASGQKSPFFVDVKQTALRPEGLRLISNLMIDEILAWQADSDHLRQIDAVAGVALGGCPLASGVALQGLQRGQAFSTLYVRKAAKDHGTAKLVEGPVFKGMRVALLEDVTTTGGSSLQAVEALKQEGLIVPLLITVVNRGPKEFPEFNERGIHFRSLLTLDDIT